MNPQQLRLYAVTDRSWLKPGETLAEVVETLLKAGVTCVQLREKGAEDALILQEARELKALCHRYGVPFLVNDRPDLAQAVGADGVHVGQEDTGLTEARNLLGPNALLGGSAHTVEEALAAQAAGADYLGCGAVFLLALGQNPLDIYGTMVSGALGSSIAFREIHKSTVGVQPYFICDVVKVPFDA